MPSNSSPDPISEIELARFAMELNAEERRQRRVLTAVQLLEHMIRQAAALVGATEESALYNPAVANLVLTAKNAAPEKAGQTDILMATTFLLSATLRCARGVVEAAKKPLDSNCDPDATIVL